MSNKKTPILVLTGAALFLSTASAFAFYAPPYPTNWLFDNSTRWMTDQKTGQMVPWSDKGTELAFGGGIGGDNRVGGYGGAPKGDRYGGNSTSGAAIGSNGCVSCADHWAPDKGGNYSDSANGGIGGGVGGSLNGSDPGNMSGSGVGY